VQEPVYLVEDDFGLFRIATKGDWNFYNVTVPGVKKTLIANATPPAAQPAPVQGPVAHLWQHSQTGRTRVVMPGGIITADASWFVVGPLVLGDTTPPAAPAQEHEPEKAEEKYYTHRKNNEK
jgi:hypothetical protein